VGVEEGDLLRICGHMFVSEKHVKGLIPEVVELFQNCRTRAKKAYAEATDPLQKKVCKARELADKVAGNGVYGALGSALSLVPLMAIAESVTAMGRNDIMLVKKTAETMFPDAIVVYGDTDSVFVRHHIAEVGTREAVEEVSGLTIALADAVNEKPKEAGIRKCIRNHALALQDTLRRACLFPQSQVGRGAANLSLPLFPLPLHSLSPPLPLPLPLVRVPCDVTELPGRSGPTSGARPIGTPPSTSAESSCSCSAASSSPGSMKCHVFEIRRRHVPSLLAITSLPALESDGL
jgi:hypothetical protein